MLRLGKSIRVRGWILLAVGGPAATAADPVRLAVAERARADFERVRRAPAQGLEDALRCVQSQAAGVAAARPAEAPLLHFRHGYCALAGALVSGDVRGFDDAARALEQALAAWPARARDRKAAPEPEPAAVAALAVIARLSAGTLQGDALDAAAARLAAARRSGACPETVLDAAECRDILAVATVWEGWVAAGRNRLEDAARLLSAERSPGWSAWVAGRRSVERAAYAEAAAACERAVIAWTAEEKSPSRRIPDGLRPPPALTPALVALGEARIAAGDPRAALAPLDSAIRRDPRRARTWYLRARAKELAADGKGALADLSVAARTALAQAGEGAAGEGRFYRGVWSFRRGDAEGAEAEFVEALNAGLPHALLPDAAAWRALAAVRTGACETSREKVESTLPAVSPLFPKAEARAAIATCGRSTSRGGEVR
jgi:tetratricopeptide (TPR) repeat protein